MHVCTRAGARVILACRSQERGDAARTDIVSDTKNENVVVKMLDLSSLKSIKKFADDISESELLSLDIIVSVEADGFDI